MSHHVTKKYAKDGVTVLWQSALCTHSAKCIRGLPEVFDINRSPWVDVEGASNEDIKAQVSKCPSGALSIVPE